MVEIKKVFQGMLSILTLHLNKDMTLKNGPAIKKRKFFGGVPKVEIQYNTNLRDIQVYIDNIIFFKPGFHSVYHIGKMSRFVSECFFWIIHCMSYL